MHYVFSDTHGCYGEDKGMSQQTKEVNIFNQEKRRVLCIASKDDVMIILGDAGFDYWLDKGGGCLWNLWTAKRGVL